MKNSDVFGPCLFICVYSLSMAVPFFHWGGGGGGGQGGLEIQKKPEK